MMETGIGLDASPPHETKWSAMKRSPAAIRKAILQFLRRGPTSYAELGRHLTTGHRTTKKNCLELERFGLITIQRQSENDPTYLVTLTKPGRTTTQQSQGLGQQRPSESDAHTPKDRGNEINLRLSREEVWQLLDWARMAEVTTSLTPRDKGLRSFLEEKLDRRVP